MSEWSATDSITTQQPLVSAVMIFLNAEMYIDESIQSVLNQTYDNWELLLVDDGSTDGSTAIARQFADRFPEKIRYLEHAHHANCGMSASRNLGFRNARGKYIALLDADDIWLPQKFQEQVAIMEAQPRAAMVCGPTEYWFSWTGNVEDLKRDHVPEFGVQTNTLFEPPHLLTQLYPLGQGPAPCLCSLLLRAETVMKLGGFEESFTGFYEDQAFLTKVYLCEPVFVSSGCWDKYRIHKRSCSAIVKDEARYDEFRKAFLRWFEEYLQSKEISDPKVWKAVNDALRPYQLSLHGSSPKYNWLRLLRVADGNVAHLEYPSDNPDFVRIAIEKAGTTDSYDIQLNHPRLKVSANHRYVINFLARADEARPISVAFAKGQAPWTNLGMYSQIDVTSEWQSCEKEFVASEDDDDARIHFDVGGSEISVELSSLTLRSLTEGRFIEPDLASNQGGSPGLERALNEPSVPIGKIDFGSFRRLTPISRDFGCDRGRPIDRYYIENFLEEHASDVRGRALEVGENTYTRRYGGDRVTVSDVLHVVKGEPQATIIADLANAEHIPSDSFDCFILTQTLQLIYDVRAAVRTIYRILKPGGVLLATFSGISQTYDNEWGECWCWNYTKVSARRLFEEGFGADNVTVEPFGNVLAATCFLHGVAVEELTAEELDYREAGYDVTITVRAQKPVASPDVQVIEGTQRLPSDHRATEFGKSLILMYHRIADRCSDPWSLCVSSCHFAQHLEILKTFGNPIRLHDLVAGLNNGGVPNRSIVVTFDDGYADNLYAARPLLERHNIPATCFLTTGYLDRNREFWWDELDRLLLQPGELPAVLQLSIGGSIHRWELHESRYYSEEQWQRDRSWKAFNGAPTLRHTLFESLWQLLQPLSGHEQRSILDELRQWAGATLESRASHRSLTRSEVHALCDGELIELGAHSVTHPALSAHSPDRQRGEILQSKADLEEWLGTRVTSFCYPYGDYTEETLSIVRGAGFDCACTTDEHVVDRNTDQFRLPRFEVRDWDGNEFSRRLSQWFDGQ